MRKLFKSIALAALVAVMIVTNGMPAMAAELEQKEVSAKAVETVESVEAVEPRATLLASYYYEGSITAGKKLDPLSINDGRPSKIKFKVNGNGGVVIIRISNRDTGDSRSFTAVGDSSWGEQTYVGSMDPGIWYVNVITTSGSGHDRLWLEFYR